MRAQINNGIIKEYPDNAIISLGSCTGKDTFEIVCELTDEFISNFSQYEVEIFENQIINIKRWTSKYQEEI